MPVWLLGIVARVLRSVALPALEALCRLAWKVVRRHEEKREKKKGALPAHADKTP